MIQAKLRRGIEKAVECCSFMCGIMADKEDSIFENQAVSQEYIEHLRENRLYKMLAYDVEVF